MLKKRKSYSTIVKNRFGEKEVGQMARRKKKDTSHMFGMLAVLLVVAAVLCALSVEMIRLKEQDEDLARREAAVIRELEEEQEKNTDLEEQRIYVQTKQYIEELAKERWGLVKPGEIILTPEK